MPNGTVYIYPQHLLLQCFQLARPNFPSSNGQKQSVSDAFQNVVLPPYSCSKLLQSWLRVSSQLQRYKKNPITIHWYLKNAQKTTYLCQKSRFETVIIWSIVKCIKIIDLNFCPIGMETMTSEPARVIS